MLSIGRIILSSILLISLSGLGYAGDNYYPPPHTYNPADDYQPQKNTYQPPKNTWQERQHTLQDRVEYTNSASTPPVQLDERILKKIWGPRKYKRRIKDQPTWDALTQKEKIRYQLITEQQRVQRLTVIRVRENRKEQARRQAEIRKEAQQNLSDTERVRRQARKAHRRQKKLAQERKQKLEREQEWDSNHPTSQSFDNHLYAEEYDGEEYNGEEYDGEYGNVYQNEYGEEYHSPR